MKGCICKRTYHRTRGVKLQNTSECIRAGIFNNANIFAIPPFTKKDFTFLIKDYTNKRVAHDMGGTNQYQPYMVVRNKLMLMIDEFAHFVDVVSNADRAIIKMAGFEVSYDPQKSKRKNKPATVQKLTLVKDKKMSGTMIANCERYPPRTIFWGFLLKGRPLPDGFNLFENGMIVFPKNFNTEINILPLNERRKVITGLEPGVIYYLYYLALNTSGCSNLSNCAFAMCL